MSKCHLASQEILKSYNAIALKPNPTETLLSKSETIDPTHTNINGISIHNWEIRTCSHSIIANEEQMDQLTSKLQAATISPRGSSKLSSPSSSPSNNISKETKKRLSPPEILFMESYVSILYQNKKVMQLDATSALLEWARSHREIEESSFNQHQIQAVSVLKSKDADLWNQRRMGEQVFHSLDVGSSLKGTTHDIASSTKSNSNFNSNSNSNSKSLDVNDEWNDKQIGTNHEFHYDWTYSTPYVGTFFASESSESSDPWQRISESGIEIKKHLLTDTTQPILYFHEIPLYEDDLHDNGDVSYSIKIRVMPTCFYILCQLYVRVDHVMVRCRETRFFHEFDPNNNDNEMMENENVNLCMYRDISWREATWNELSGFQLPTDVRMWRMTGGASDRIVQSQLQRMPCVSLPETIPNYSCMKI